MRPGPLWENMLIGCATALMAFACTSDKVEGVVAADERVTITREPLAVAAGAALVGRVRYVEALVPSTGRLHEASTSSAERLREAPAPAAGRLLVVVNDTPQVVPLAPDGSFQVRGLPAGELRFKAELGELPGVIVIADVSDGELVEVSLEPQPEHLAIELTRRAQPARAAEREAGRLEVLGDDAVYHLGAGAYGGSVTVLGDGATLLGAHEGEACDNARRTIVLGDLVIEGEGVSVYDVAVGFISTTPLHRGAERAEPSAPLSVPWAS
jgi:hypothetical protein